MNEINEKIIEKLKAMELEISKEKGEFSLFGVFLRKDAPDKYDLVVSAPWMETDYKGSLEYLTKQVQSKLEQDELLSISRIVLLEKGNPEAEAINKAFNVKHGSLRVRDTNFFGVQISQACISTSAQIDPNVGN